jgi:DNA-binding transcriptional MerR regulator
MTIAEIKAHQEKVGAQLHEAKALLEEFEAHARKNKAQAEIDTIKGLKAKKQGIEEKLQHLVKTGVEAKAATQIKADIDAELGKLKTSLEEVKTKLKGQPAAH